jgi:hypothetical protein
MIDIYPFSVTRGPMTKLTFEPQAGGATESVVVIFDVTPCKILRKNKKLTLDCQSAKTPRSGSGFEY